MRYYMYEVEPMADMLNNVLAGLFSSGGGAGCGGQQTGGCPARSSWWEEVEPCLMAAMNHPAMWQLFNDGRQDSGPSSSPCGRRRGGPCGGFRRRWPEIWEETVDVTGLNPHSIEVHPAEGNRIVIQGTLPGKEAAAATKEPQAGEQVSKSVELPEGVIKRTIRCYLANGKVHISALKKPSENPAAAERKDVAQKEGATTSKEPEGARSCTAEDMAACAAKSNNEGCPCRCDGAKKEVSDPRAQVSDFRAQASDLRAQASDPSAQVSDPSAQVSDPSAQVSDPSAQVTDPSAQVSAASDDKDESEAAFTLVSKDGHCEDMETGGSHVDDVTTGTGLEDEMEEVTDEIEEELKDATDENAETNEQTSVLRRVSLDEPAPVIEEPADDDTTVVPSGDQQPFLRKFNLSGFQPSEIKVKLHGRTLTVSAEHKEEAEDFVNFRQFHQSLTVEHDVILPEMTSRLQDDGTLVITAPTEAVEDEESERLLAIQH